MKGWPIISPNFFSKVLFTLFRFDNDVSDIILIYHFADDNQKVEEVHLVDSIKKDMDCDFSSEEKIKYEELWFWYIRSYNSS